MNSIIGKLPAGLLQTSSLMAEVAGYLWQRGWAELNAGNMAVDVSSMMDGFFYFNDSTFYEIPEAMPAIGGKSFLVTATGSRMRNISHEPANHVVLIKLSENGTAYRMQCLGSDNLQLKPTSELPTHLGIFNMLAQRGSSEKAILHTHATELIALTQIKEFCSEEKLNRLLWSMHPETIIFVPKGIGFVPYTLPGTAAIAQKTIDALAEHHVALWEKHGVFAIGKSVENAFDLIDILAKSALVFFTCRKAGFEPEGLTIEQLTELKLLSEKFA